ncbi:MAG: hypothetical protein KatS3mg108_3072 [Isosphaeraceae bacterium]|jgi:ribosomal protein L16 Arg81 hydroxylase|nr:MAG: hypothetical protein KatS3mg108_3072 [Isosphaeraceae bacterium]
MADERVMRNGTESGREDVSNPVLAFWTDYFTRTGEQSKAFFEGLHTLMDPQKLQQRWMELMAESFEDFLRSPAFLEMMRQNLKTVTDLKKAQDKALEEMARAVGFPLASDIHGLFERMAALERALMVRLEAVEARVEALGEKLGVEGAGGSAEGGAKPKRGRVKRSGRR